MSRQRHPGAIDRVAVVADGLGSASGVSDIVAHLRDSAVAGYDCDVIESDVVRALASRHYDAVHVFAPRPAAAAAMAVARELRLPVVAGYEPTDDTAASAFYSQCHIVLSPSRAADLQIERLGLPRERIARWARGVDLERFHPARYAPEALPAGFNVLYSGPLSRDHGLDLLAEAILIARDRDPRIRLALAGAGVEQVRLRAQLRASATFLGTLDRDQLAQIYATADLLVSPGPTAASAHVILEAQASGLPVLAADCAVAADLIESGRSGCLVEPEPGALAGAIRGLARRETLCDRLATGGLMAVRGHSLERSAAELAAAYARTIHGSVVHAEVARAA